ncbi:etoposide-induced protein 2.4-domain-containing protein [Phellopilus nigrolimitatus]|nr:etoposide-induced protein 2.4-domain-containing protein [Phellopilus nigrolimitatus]
MMTFAPTTDFNRVGPRSCSPLGSTRHDTGYHYQNSTSQARASYPTFLSLPETLSLQFSWAWRGLVDAFRWDIVISTIFSDSEIRANVLKSLVLNVLSLSSIYVFDLILQPLVRDQQKWLHRNMGWFYRVLWLFPVVGASLYLNSSWCSVVANRTYMLRHGSRKAAAPSTYSGILTALATSAYRGVMICTSIAISFALAYVPIVGNSAGFVFFCWVDAYYCFEFIWIARGLSLAQRIRYLEERWAYFFAFGLPSSALCMWGSSLANAALFALVLPSYIIMAMHAKPVPSNPYNPVPRAMKSSYESSDSNSIRYPSPFILIRMPIFAPVLWINDRVVRVLSVGGRRSRQYNQGAGARANTSGRRAMSDTTVESVEEGDGDVTSTAAGYSAVGGKHVSGGTRAFAPGLRKKAD